MAGSWCFLFRNSVSVSDLVSVSVAFAAGSLVASAVISSVGRAASWNKLCNKKLADVIFWEQTHPSKLRLIEKDWSKKLIDGRKKKIASILVEVKNVYKTYKNLTNLTN